MSAKDKSEELYANLRSNLENIRNKEGVIGYILRDSKSAFVDINDPTKIIDYAMLSAESLETGEVVSEIFQLGSMNSLVVEGNDIKILSLVIDDQRLSIFMNKKVDHNKISKELDSTKHNQKRNASLDQNSEENQEQNKMEVLL
jgi:predicted regulator of Ras-like GTPase activity (Roadblock/LC7/MglB family)